MTIKQILAGIGCKILCKAQFATGGRCGGFGLHEKLWRNYTDGYRHNRSGYILQDYRNAKVAN